jgi:hypothetical protein
MSYQNLSTWANNFGQFKNVQEANTAAAERGGFLSAESVAIFAGPSTLGNVSSANLHPIGLIQNFSLQQQRQLNQIFEIGSRPAYFVGGRTIVRASLARVLFDGPSLMQCLYSQTDGTASLTVPTIPTTTSTGPYVNPTNPYAPGPAPYAANTVVDPNATAPTTGLFWINLASNLFNKPLGLGIVMYDMQGQPYGGVYLERCFIQTHNFSMSSEQVVLAESVQLTATHTRPLSQSLA